jgi:hypothetical protein
MNEKRTDQVDFDRWRKGVAKEYKEIDKEYEKELKARGKTTGTKLVPLVGLDSYINGRIGKPYPRSTDDCNSLLVEQIRSQVAEGIEELLARAKFDPQKNSETNADSDLWQIKRKGKVIYFESMRWKVDEEFADRIEQGLWSKLQSKNQKIRKNAEADLTKFLQSYTATEQADAIDALARISETAAGYLELLWRKSPEEVRPIAGGLSQWPVNLSLEGGAEGKRRLYRSGFARTYIMDLGVNTSPTVPGILFTGRKGSKGKNESPFPIAANLLYRDLITLREQHEHFFFKSTQWKKKLLNLDYPISEKNVDDWWKVALEWLVEIWKNEDPRPLTFWPLIHYIYFEHALLFMYEEPLPTKAKSHVFVAMIGGNLHIRIFNHFGEQVIDKGESMLNSSVDLDDLRKLFESGSAPDISKWSQNEKQKIIDQVISISGHTVDPTTLDKIKCWNPGDLRRKILHSNLKEHFCALPKTVNANNAEKPEKS